MINLPRNTPKADWKRLYRLWRVTVREAHKATMDMMLFGSGYVYIENGKDPEHIPIEKVRYE